VSFSKLRAAFQEGEEKTHPEHPDGSLRGRTYAIPFATVWAAIVQLASAGLRGWVVTSADEDQGILEAECRRWLFRDPAEVAIQVSLDENGQTRVDMASAVRTGGRVLGGNARRMRAFFRALDDRIDAGPGTILDPTLPLIRTSLLLLGLLCGCSPSEEPPREGTVVAEDTLTTQRNFQPRSYERHIVFLTFQGDSTLLVPWSFTARTRPDGVERRARGWLARGNSWDPFFSEEWKDPPNAAPWRVLPHGPLRLIVGLGDALETIIFQEGTRNLEITLGELLVEWSGQRAQGYRVHEASVLLGDRRVEGYLLDMTRGWTDDGDPPGDWGILLSGDSLQVVMEDLAPSSNPEGGAFSLWARVEFLERRWQGVRLAWSEVRAFEEARRDVPLRWGIQSPEGDLSGALATVAPHLEAGTGAGPILPVDALFQVEGNLTLAGEDFPVRGFIRHLQR